MKDSSFLMEIGCEELPGSAQLGFSKSLSDYFKKSLQEKGVAYLNLHTYSTPRRIAVKITGITLRKNTDSKIVKGPWYEKSYDSFGAPTKACIGFAKAHGTPIGALSILEEQNGSKRIACILEKKSQTVKEIFKEISSCIDKKISMPNSMRWGMGLSSFYRPVRLVLSMLDKELVHINLFGVNSNDKTASFKYFSNENSIKVPSADQYALVLLKNNIIADYAARKAIIQNSLQKFCVENEVYINKKLLQEVANLTEWPVLIRANFNPYFLSLPKEVLFNVICSHMRSFAMQDSECTGNSFIIVCNNEFENISPIVHGYEKVVNSRLSDVKFFYQTDKKTNFKKHLIHLSSLSFQSKVGSMSKKVSRIIELTLFLCGIFAIPSEIPSQISLLSKCDLMTNLVHELPELQGIIGSHYAKISGECFEVCSGIREIYLPRYSKDLLPSTRAACIASLSDRLDTLLGTVGSGKKATGDRDPYGLRRLSSGILRIIIKNRISADLPLLLERSLFNYDNIAFSLFIIEETLIFLSRRMKFLYKENGYKEMVFDSLLTRSKSILDIQDKAVASKVFMRLKVFGVLTSLEKRIRNLLKKHNFKTRTSVKKHLFNNMEEWDMYRILQATHKNLFILINFGMYYEALLITADFMRELSKFLDNILVMEKDVVIRKNRIAILLDSLYVINMVVDWSSF